MIEKFKLIFKVLEDQGVDYILIGGYAVVLLGFNRFTEDIDIIVSNSHSNIEKLRIALKKIYTDESINEITFEELNEYNVLRYGTPDGFGIDIIANLGTAFNFNNINYEYIEFEDQSIKVATAESLFDMKKDTVRNSDKIDATFLYDLISKRKQNDSKI